jgi:membrane protein DedA with SNARE-associated domain
LVAQIWLLLQHYDTLALYVLLAIEESGIPIPIPGDFVMSFFGYRAQLGLTPWYMALVAGVAATQTGSCILYHVGRKGGRPLLQRYGRYLHLDEARQDRIEGWLARYGGFAVFFGRLVPGMRCGSSFVAGTFGVRYTSFFLGTLASATVWWSIFLYLGSRLGSWVAPVVQEHPHTLLVFLGFLALTSLLPIYVRYRIGQEKAVARSIDPYSNEGD